MTVCVGAICSDPAGREFSAVVVASDRMVTMGGFVEFEHDIPKAAQVSPVAIIMGAGEALKASQIIRHVQGKGLDNSNSLEEIVHHASEQYAELRKKEIDAIVFRPRGITIDEFYRGLQTQMVQGLAQHLDNFVANHNFGVDLLVAGVDQNGGHLFHVFNPGGTFEDFHPIGFGAIGSGQLHATQSLIGFAQSGRRSLRETIFNIYASKRRAEVAPGVGKDTDLFIITQNEIIRLNDDHLAHLEQFYQDYAQPISEDLKNQMEEIQIEIGAGKNENKSKLRFPFTSQH